MALQNVRQSSAQLYRRNGGAFGRTAEWDALAEYVEFAAFCERKWTSDVDTPQEEMTDAG